MITFGTAITDLLDYVNRPVDEFGPQAAREINNTIMLMQRKHAFKYTERLINLPFPADALSVNIVEAAGGTPRDFISIQQTGSANQNMGKPLRMKGYDELTRMAHKYDRSNGADEFTDQTSDDPRTLGHYVSTNGGYYAYLINRDFGLFPKPSSVVNLLIHLHIWLPPLVQDSDSNFFLDYCYDYVLTKSLTKLNFVLKKEGSYPVTKAELDELWETVVRWDGQIGNTPGETI